MDALSRRVNCKAACHIVLCLTVTCLAVGAATTGSVLPLAADQANSASTQVAAEEVTVDFATDLGPVTYRASGFLHGITPAAPGHDLAEALKPRLFRSAEWRAFAIYERVKRMGARSQVVVSDSYGYPPNGPWPGDGGDWRRWEQVVGGLVAAAKENGYIFEWDIWNEPDGKYFWGRGREQFLETWRRGVLTARRIDPRAIIVGPSLAQYDREFLTSFLLYAKEHRVLPDILSWHEFSCADWQIPAHVTEIRAVMARNQIAITRICLNEVINEEDELSPGATTWFFSQLEAARVDGACHATWREPDADAGKQGDRLLSGILTYVDQQPRSAWWAYKGYADITGRLVEVRPSTTVAGVAGTDRRHAEARLVLGRMGGAPGAITLRLIHLDKASYLAKDGKVHIVAQRIPAMGWNALVRPVPVMAEDVKSQQGELVVTLPEFGPSDAYLVEMLQPGGG